MIQGRRMYKLFIKKKCWPWTLNNLYPVPISCLFSRLLRYLTVFRKLISETKNVAPWYPDKRQLHEKGVDKKEGEKEHYKGKVTSKRDLQRKERRRQKDEKEKEKGVERGLKALKHFALPAQQMPYSAWQSERWLYLYPQCHFRASTGPESTHAPLLQRDRLAVLSAESRHGSGVFISSLLLKCCTRLTNFWTRHLTVDTRCRLSSYYSLAAFKLAGPSVRKWTDWAMGSVKPVRLPWLPAITAIRSAVHLEVACLRYLK